MPALTFCKHRLEGVTQITPAYDASLEKVTHYTLIHQPSSIDSSGVGGGEDGYIFKVTDIQIIYEIYL